MSPEHRNLNTSEHAPEPEHAENGIQNSSETGEQASLQTSFNENGSGDTNSSHPPARLPLNEPNLRANDTSETKRDQRLTRTSRAEAIQKAAQDLGFRIPPKYFEGDRSDKEGWFTAQAAFYTELKGN